MDEGEFSNAVTRCTFVVAETNMEVGGGFRGAAKGRLIQEAVLFVKIEEIFFDESKGLASTGALEDEPFSDLLWPYSASVQTKAGPVKDRGCATEERLAIMHCC